MGLEMFKALQKIIFMKPVSFGPATEASAKAMLQQFFRDFSKEEHKVFVTYFKKHYEGRIGELSLLLGYACELLVQVLQGLIIVLEIPAMWCHAFWTSPRRNQASNAGIEGFHSAMKRRLKLSKQLLCGRPLAWLIHDVLTRIITYYQEQAFLKEVCGVSRACLI